MRYDTHDTIVARASAVGSAVRSVVRLSGPEATSILAQLAPGIADQLPSVPRAIDTVLDVVLHGRPVSLPATALIWPNDRSFTRQRVVELQLPGGPPIMAAVIRRATESGARLAEPGEFTLRAFLAGRIDLTQAEAVLGVIDARGEAALETALGQLAGGISTPLATVRSDLVGLLADIEAGLDFVDEDIEFVGAAEIVRRLQAALDDVAGLEWQLAARSRDDDLPRVVLTGAPNAGKSSLFNILVQRFAVEPEVSRAIVSPTPGATRDALCAALEIEGQHFELCDTAGLVAQVATGGIESAAQEVARETAHEADLHVLCIPLGDFRPRADAGNHEQLIAMTKCDLATSSSLATGSAPATGAVRTSTITGAGIDELVARIAAAISDQAAGRSQVIPSTAARCGESLRRASDSLTRARGLASSEAGDELVAAEIRAALDDLGNVAGTVSTDDVLDEVFGRFCIGK